MTELIGKDIDRYHIIEQLGQGGMAVVYKAYDTRLERDVALKVIRRNAFSLDILERVLKRFDREAKSLAKLTHPNIVSIIDYGEYDGSPYLVMPYLVGGTLKQSLGQPMPWKQAFAILSPIAGALAYAHQKGIVHRDVKPGNILVTEGGAPMLTDFGIARLLECEETQTLTATGVGIGTPEYMSPEQGMGREVDGRSDIYSLGVVLYELITGHTPYTADTPMAVVLKQSTEPLPRPGSYIQNLPEEVEKVLYKALAKKPEDRYQSMDEFAAAMSRLERSEHKGQVVELSQPAPKTVIQPEMETLATVEQYTREDVKTNIEQLPVQSLEPQVSSKQKKPISVGKMIGFAMLGIGLIVIVIGVINGWFTQTTPSTELSEKRISEKDGMTMMYVPAGEFTMGSTFGVGEQNEYPEHKVFLNAYWMDQTEVTNAMYEKCVDDGKCTKPWADSSETREQYFSNEMYADYPVIFVDWYQAQEYCTWAGRELPTEAQWEKAAKGTVYRHYPWGNALPDGNLVNICDKNCYYEGSIQEVDDGYVDTAPVGSYPNGASPYGVLDLAGNVWEWVADSYGDYSSFEQTDPINVSDETARVLRGGSWLTGLAEISTTYRGWEEPSKPHRQYGFRCAMDAE